MAKYTITNQKELRRSFWEFCKEFGGEFEREANKKKHSFKLDFNIALIPQHYYKIFFLST